jgi:hypothetical protein
MSSCQSFLRQRVTGSTVLPAVLATDLYVFVAGPGNYVGNYPPGAMVPAATAGAVLPTLPAGVVLRDMGKTIKASVASSAAITVVGTTFGTPGFFREVQLLVPSTVATPLTASPFGVGIGAGGAANGAQSYPAGNTGDAGYGTFYIPIVVGGVVASNSTSTAPLAVTAAGIRVGEQL